MALREIEIPQSVDIAGGDCTLIIEIVLVGADGAPLVGFVSGDDDLVAGRLVVVSALDDQVVTLTTQDSIAPQSSYWVRISGPGISYVIKGVQVPAGVGVLPWEEFISVGAPVDPADIWRTRLLPVGASNGDVAIWSSAAGVWVPGPQGGAGGVHAASHEVGGVDEVDHDLLSGFVLNEHIDWTDATSLIKTTTEQSGLAGAATQAMGAQVWSTWNPLADETDAHAATHSSASISASATHSWGTALGLLSQAANATAQDGGSLIGVLGSAAQSSVADVTDVIGLQGDGLASGGVVGNVAGVVSNPVVTDGNVTNVFGLRIPDLAQHGGTVANRYGLYLGDYTGSAANDYGIYQDGSQPNILNGPVNGRDIAADGATLDELTVAVSATRKLTQAEYDAIPAPDPTTLYLICG